MIGKVILADTKVLQDIEARFDFEENEGFDFDSIELKLNTLNKEDKKRCLCDILDLNYNTSMKLS